jgi:hypothetical protein
MNYLLTLIAVFCLSFILTEIYYRFKHKKIVTVKIIDKDGSERFVQIKPGRDPEVDALIASIKKQKGSA